eukprot:31445-Pelagococcus_subviridis.AAC.6
MGISVQNEPRCTATTARARRRGKTAACTLESSRARRSAAAQTSAARAWTAAEGRYISRRGSNT